MRPSCVKRCFLILTLLAIASRGLPQPAQVILIRHAEKPSDPNAVDLSKEGQRRAEALVPFLTQEPSLTKYGPPVALYATERTKHGHSVRTRETIAPLARELRLTIQTPYPAESYRRLARSILGNPKYRGKTVLVCWVHDYIPQLAAALGVRPEPPKWKGDVYDRVYVISYESGKAALQELPQNLFPKDVPHKRRDK